MQHKKQECYRTQQRATLSRGARLLSSTQQAHVAVEKAVDCNSFSKHDSDKILAQSCLPNCPVRSPGTSSPRSEGISCVRLCADRGRVSSFLGISQERRLKHEKRDSTAACSDDTSYQGLPLRRWYSIMRDRLRLMQT